MTTIELFGKIPVPSAPAHGVETFRKALRRGELAGARCEDCGTVGFPAAPVCGACGGDRLRSQTLPDAGVLHAATEISAAPGALARQAPYWVGLVDVGQVRVLCRLLGAAGQAFEPGMDIRLGSGLYADGETLIGWPAGEAIDNLIHERRSPDMATDHARNPGSFSAIVVNKDEDGYRAGFDRLTFADLPDEDVLVRVDYSALNYKDALAITGKAPICRSFPMVPGIDLAGTVIESRGPRFSPGDQVILNGYGLSETRWGAYSRYQRFPEHLLMRQPAGLSQAEAMMVGTAGYTAMLCVMALTDHGLTPESGGILITGASGGVGSVALSLLARAGYRTIAVTGRPEQADFLRSLGATDIVSRADIGAGGRALGRERWAGVVDVAGGSLLADVIAQTQYDGIVACCGMAGGGDLPATVYPFILRGVTLRGVDSVMVPMPRRERAWQRLTEELSPEILRELGQLRDFADLPALAEDLLEGRLHGRIAIDMASAD